MGREGARCLGRRRPPIRERHALVEEAAATKTTQEWLAVPKLLSIPVVKTTHLEALEDDPT